MIAPTSQRVHCDENTPYQGCISLAAVEVLHKLDHEDPSGALSTRDQHEQQVGSNSGSPPSGQTGAWLLSKRYYYNNSLFNIDLYNKDRLEQVGEMKGKETRLFIMSRIRIAIRLCSLPIHSPGICMLGPIE